MPFVLNERIDSLSQLGDVVVSASHVAVSLTHTNLLEAQRVMRLRKVIGIVNTVVSEIKAKIVLVLKLFQCLSS